MIHVTCDLCGKDLRPGEDPRFVVKIEVYAAHDPYALTEDDLDDDHLEAVSAQLQEAAGEPLPGDGDDALPTHQRFDLCPSCRKKYLKDPLGREATLHFNFSNN